MNTEDLVEVYPFQTIVSQTLINDSIPGKRVLVVFDPASETGAILDQNFEGRTLGFDILLETSDGITLTKNRETGST